LTPPPIYLYRCDRCAALFALFDLEETYGPCTKEELLLANGCPACGKGSISPFGRLTLDLQAAR